jgi:hydroxymethylpyrimidine/phosphomethylpyrimidine kinase
VNGAADGRPRVLVVGGHDPSGAGVDADLAALRGLAVEARAVVTAWTDQDERGVRAVGARACGEWLAEAREAARPRVGALKLGLLPGAEHVAAAAALVLELRERDGGALPVVVDPVIAASSGGRFLDAAAVAALARGLLAAGVVATPNLAEAAELARFAGAAGPGGAAALGGAARLDEARLAADRGARVEAAERLLGLGARAVVLKGGHGLEDPALDLVLAAGEPPLWLAHRRIPGAKVRGSGCRFASRLAAGLALGSSLAVAAAEAGAHVAQVLAERGTGR